MCFVYSTSIIPYLFNSFLKEAYFRSTFNSFYWWRLDFNIYIHTIMHTHSQENINSDIWVRFPVKLQSFSLWQTLRAFMRETLNTWSCWDMTVPSKNQPQRLHYAYFLDGLVFLDHPLWICSFVGAGFGDQGSWVPLRLPITCMVYILPWEANGLLFGLFFFLLFFLFEH